LAIGEWQGEWRRQWLGEWIGLGMGMRMALGSLAFMTFSPTGSFTRRIIHQLD